MDSTRETIIVDFNTIMHDPPAVKAKTVEYISNHPDTLISVLNGNEGSSEEDTSLLLRILRFPYDIVVVNPLRGNYAPIVFKTMFASRVAEQGYHSVGMILDDDAISQQMWSDAGLLEREE